MRLEYNLTNYYDNSYDIKFQGSLNDAHWFVWDVSSNYIELCHDTDEVIINACKVLGNILDVWIDDVRVECPLEVRTNSWSNSEAVYVTLPVFPEDNALDKGPYDSETNAEIV